MRTLIVSDVPPPCACGCGGVTGFYKKSNKTSRRYTKFILGHFKDAYVKRPYEGLYNAFAYQAKRRGLLVGLSYEDFVNLTKITECFYCGFEIKWAIRNPWDTGSLGSNLDRKNNDEGYTKENSVVCCKRCNQAKSNHFTYEEFLQIGAVIRTFKRPMSSESNNKTV